MSKPDAKYIDGPLYQTEGRKIGWWGLNLADQEDYLPPYQFVDIMNFTNRLGLKNNNIGVLATRPGIADLPKFEMHGLADLTATAYPVRLLAKFFPNPTLTSAPQILRIVGADGSGTFQKFNKATGGWTTLTYSAASGGGPVSDLSHGISGGYYPQWIIYDVPSGPWFVWCDPVNGVYIYDGTEVTVCQIPKNLSPSEFITGALWLAQIEGLLVVGGNVTDAGEAGVLYYCAAGDPTLWSSDNGGGSQPVYGATSRGGDSPPRYMTGIAELGRMLVVFTEDMRYIVYGLGTASFDRSVEPGMGCASGKTIVTWGGSIYWMGKKGIYKWSGGEPRRIHREIWNKFQNVAFGDDAGNPLWHQFHAFSFSDQYWICLRSTEQDGSYVNTNWIYDFVTEDWYIFDIPMTCAFSSLGGFDLGGLFFASGRNFGTVGSPQYKTFRYGFDDSDTHGSVRIFADIYTDAADTPSVRKSHAITAFAETGKLHFGYPLKAKQFLAAVIRLGITDSGSSDYQSEKGFTYARARVDFDDAGVTTNLSFPTSESEVAGQAFHYLGIPDTTTGAGHFIQLFWQVSAKNKRVHLKQCYMQFNPLEKPLYLPR